MSEAIESVINQTYTNWELIIVNDGSTDNSLAVAKRFESDKIKVYTKTNAGAAAARNFGYQQSNGEFIKFFDADDIINTQMLAEQVYLAKQNLGSIISSKWGRFYNNDIATFKLSPDECWQNMKPVDWICSSWKNGQSMTQPGMFLIPKNIIAKTGLWNEKLSLIDDLEFFTKIILSSQSVIYCSKATLYYRSGVINNLSGQKSNIALESAYLSIDLATNNLLSIEYSERTLQCCANTWQVFVYSYFHLNTFIIKKAEIKIKQYGGSNIKFAAGGITKQLLKAFNWKFVVRLKRILNFITNLKKQIYHNRGNFFKIL